jgi:hypothetical protein
MCVTARLFFDPVSLSAQRQQSRRRYAANGFAFVPHTCRFLGRQRWVVEPPVKPVGCAFTVVPVLPLKQGRPSPTEVE